MKLFTIDLVYNTRSRNVNKVLPDHEIISLLFTSNI